MLGVFANFTSYHRPRDNPQHPSMTITPCMYLNLERVTTLVAVIIVTAELHFNFHYTCHIPLQSILDATKILFHYLSPLPTNVGAPFMFHFSFTSRLQLPDDQTNRFVKGNCGGRGIPRVPHSTVVVKPSSFPPRVGRVAVSNNISYIKV